MRKPTVVLCSTLEGREVAREFVSQLASVATITLWSEGAYRPGLTVVESLTEVADRSDFAVFVLTTDDTLSQRGERVVPRTNIVFELGFLAGRLGLDRTFLLVPSHRSLELPSDLAGAMYVQLSWPSDVDIRESVAPAAAAVRRTISAVGPRVPDEPQYSSCFISYSWQDKDFAAQLYTDLQKVGVRCWLDAKELKGGRRISEQVDRAVQAHDRVLLVLSEASVKSPWVRAEVRNATALERTRRNRVLFPVRLDDAVLREGSADEFEHLREHYIIDFRNWHEKAPYRQAFAKLVRDLAISTSMESGGRA